LAVSSLQKHSHLLDRILDRIGDCAQRWPLPVLGVALVLALLGGWYVKNNLHFNTDTADMLSENLEWRQNYQTYRDSFPQYRDNIVVVIDGTTPDLAQDASTALADALRQRNDLFIEVFEPEFSEFLRTEQLLFLDRSDLQDLSDHLATVQPFLALLVDDPTLPGLFDTLREGIDSREDQDFLELSDAFDLIAAALNSYQQGRYSPLSWQQLMTGEKPTSDLLRSVVVLRPKLDYSKMLAAEEPVKYVRELAKEMQLVPERGVTVRMTGGAALAYEELLSVIKGTQRASLAALCLVAVFLLWGLRSIWLAVATILTLVLGLIYTAWFATFAIGELNLISVAFAVLYIGLGVDFAIHYALRYQEARRDKDVSSAIRTAGIQVGRSLVLCATTTAIGFYAFVPTDYSGVAELGLISGTGMFISLFVSLTVLPALLRLFPNKAVNHQRGVPAWLTYLPTRRPRLIVSISGVVGLVALLALPQIRFDHNPLHLQNPDDESVQTYRELLDESSRSPYSIALLADNAAQAENLKADLLTLSSVDSVVTINDYLPDNQEDKLAIIDDLNLLLGGDLTLNEPTERIEPARFETSLQNFRASLDQLIAEQPAGRLRTAALALAAVLDRESAALAKLEPQAQTERLGQLDEILMSGMPGRLRLLNDGLKATRFGVEDLPEAIRGRWISAEGRYRMEVFPRENLDDNIALERFVAEVRKVAPNATDVPVINVAASQAVVSAFQQAFLSALLVIAALLAVLLPIKRDIPLVLAPLLLAGLVTAGICALLNIDLNFANIIALPLLLGIGVDSGIHIVHRFRSDRVDGGVLLRTSTARAVIFSAMTTIASFGNLALSPHLGTASMGILLTIGITVTLFATLLVLPALLSLWAVQGRSA
jgi:hopanoid biosynthesis associated RND transporter like protein HpnN